MVEQAYYISHKEVIGLRNKITELEAQLDAVREILDQCQCTSICTELADSHTTAAKVAEAGVPCLYCKLQKALGEK